MRADDHGGKRRIRLDGTAFVRRLLLHVLPGGIKRLRHYGVLASACKADKLAAARQPLQVPAVNPPAIESAQAFMQRVARIDVSVCPCCKVGRLHVVAVLQGQARLPAPQAEGAALKRRPDTGGFAARQAALVAMLRAGSSRSRLTRRTGANDTTVRRVSCHASKRYTPNRIRAPS